MEPRRASGRRPRRVHRRAEQSGPPFQKQHGDRAGRSTDPDRRPRRESDRVVRAGAVAVRFDVRHANSGNTHCRVYGTARDRVVGLKPHLSREPILRPDRSHADPSMVRRTLALSCEAPAPTAIGAMLRQFQPCSAAPSPPGRCQRGGRAGPTRVTNVNSLVPALAEISQQPSVGNMSPLAWNPVG